MIEERRETIERQGTVVSTWRIHQGRKLGPYYRLAWREDGRQRSVYLGRSEELAQAVEQRLDELQRPLRRERQLKDQIRRAWAALRAYKLVWASQLAVYGLYLHGWEARGLRRTTLFSEWPKRRQPKAHGREGPRSSAHLPEELPHLVEEPRLRAELAVEARSGDLPQPAAGNLPQPTSRNRPPRGGSRDWPRRRTSVLENRRNGELLTKKLLRPNGPSRTPARCVRGPPWRSPSRISTRCRLPPTISRNTSPLRIRARYPVAGPRRLPVRFLTTQKTAILMSDVRAAGPLADNGVDCIRSNNENGRLSAQ
jgi:hypothetical protein